jgi:hypothetical protein
VELADHVADGARTLLELGTGLQAQLTHRVNDASLHRLEAVTDVRQRTIEDDVHRVVEVRLLRILAKGDALDAVIVDTAVVSHG